MNVKTKILLIIAMLAVPAAHAAFKCKDEKGVTHVGDTPPAACANVVARARDSGCASISYTYTEPTIFGEFAYDTAVLARQEGIRNVFVSNGFMTEESATAMAEVIDGDNVDLKSFRDDFYRKVCKARLQPVLDTIQRLKKLGVWLEVTTLVIPGLNDSEEELTEIANFLKDVGPDIPWHVSAFYPTHDKLDRPRTPAAYSAQGPGYRP